MAIVATDWEVATSGAITYTGSAHGVAGNSYATVIEFHRWLQDLADDAVAVGTTNDYLDITDSTPSDRATDNLITLNSPYFIDDTAAEHLYDGSIVQNGGDDIYDGIVNFGNTAFIAVIQDGALITNDFWNTKPDGQAVGTFNGDSGQGISHRFLVKVRSDGANIDGRRLLGTTREFGNTYSEFPINGSARGNNVLALSDANDLNNETVAGTVSGWTTIANVTEGYNTVDVDGDGTPEPYYSEWNKDTYTINQFYERMKWLTRRDTASTLYGIDGDLFRGITHEIAYDGEAGTGITEGNYLVWGTNITWDTPDTTSLTVGEYYTFSLSGAVGKCLANDDNTTTGNAVFAIESGTTVLDNDVLTRVDGTASDGVTVNVTITGNGDPGGVGLVLADDAVDQVWIQLMSGQVPVDNQVMWDSTLAGVMDQANSATVNVTVTDRPISQPFIGASTGSALIGAYGITLEAPSDVTKDDRLTDLTTTVNPPPNNVTFTVSGLVVGDRVFVAPRTGSLPNYAQLSLDATLSTDNITSFTATEAEPGTTPDAGTVRVVDDDGVHRLLNYTSITGAGPITFNGITAVETGSEDFLTVNATAANDVYISYIDKAATSTSESFTAVYDTDVDLFVRVRDGGGDPIKTFESVTATITNTGGSVGAIRTSDE